MKAWQWLQLRSMKKILKREARTLRDVGLEQARAFRLAKIFPGPIAPVKHVSNGYSIYNREMPTHTRLGVKYVTSL